MGGRHVEELFSAAYDGALDDTARRRWDEHLAGCSRCAAAYDDFRRSVDAVRELPPARMPVRVVLPATPPLLEPAIGGGLFGRLRGALPERFAGWLRVPHLGPAWGAGAMAAVGVAAVALVVHGHLGGGGSGGPLSDARSALPALGLTQGGAGANGAKHAALSSCPMPVLVTNASGAAVSSNSPEGFANRVTVHSPDRPGQELTLATTSRHYAPGSQVLVFAALTSSAGTRAVVPCVTLEPHVPVAVLPTAQIPEGAAVGGGDSVGLSGPADGAPSSGNAAAPPPSSANAAASPASGGSAAAGENATSGSVAPPPQPGGKLQQFTYGGAYQPLLTPDQVEAFSPYQLEVPLAVAVPSGQTVAGSLPVQVLTIPSTLARGTVLRLVAVVPSGAPNSSDKPAIEAVITIDVS
jgi:anti-sigma factor RsiW